MKMKLITTALQNLVCSKQNFFQEVCEKNGFGITKSLIFKIKWNFAVNKP